MQHLTNAARDLLVLADTLPVDNELEQVEEIFGRLKEYFDTREAESKEGWWFGTGASSVNGTDLLSISIDLESENDEKTVEEFLEPPFSADTICIEEYGGRTNFQQSIVIRITGEDDDGRSAHAEIQIEINPKTGEFETGNFGEWDVCYDDEDEYEDE